MEYILVLLIVALLNGAIAYIDGLMEGIIPLTLYAEQYMSTLAGVDLFQSLFDIVFGFGVSLIVLKFLKKGFETYVSVVRRGRRRGTHCHSHKLLQGNGGGDLLSHHV